MRRRAGLTVLAAALCGTLVASCARHDTASTAAPPRPLALVNPSTFPLYGGSRVVSVVPVDSKQMFAAIKAGDPTADLPRNFHGSEIIAETSASLPQLRSWVTGLEHAPPHGLHKVVQHDKTSSSNFGDSRGAAVGAQFETADRTRTIFVVAADPKKLHDQMGPAFTLIDSYGVVPGMMRGTIDEQAKKSLGYSVSELLDARSPIGAVISTVKRMQSTDRRAILVIDATQAR